MLVEVCCNSLESALNAEQAGADRIELCAELGVGGVTPSHGLLALVKEKLSIPIHVLVRPRSGHFTYTQTELEVMKADIEFCKELGVDGIVFGVLNKDFYVHLEQMAELVELTKPLHFTFHRAFDWVVNPFEALEQLERMGVQTILTSGQLPKAENALAVLSNLQKKTKKITIMAGGGINATNALQFKRVGLKAIHLSGTTFTNLVDVSHKIPMNSDNHLQEHQVAVTHSEIVEQVVAAVK